MLDFIWLIPLLPLLSAVLLAVFTLFNLFQGEAGEKVTVAILLSALSLSFFLLIGLDILFLTSTLPNTIIAGTWFQSGDYQINFSFILDGYSLIMATQVALICLITVRFSVNYLHREKGFQRFFMVMGAFSCAMLLIFMAGNLVLVFVGWELAGVSSYLLICYFYDRENAAENATRIFITNRIGDVGFIVAIALSFIWFGGVEWDNILHPKYEIPALFAGFICLGLLLAAMVKSALVPFSPWIAKALEGPTPSSAIFYGSLMVHAGVYLMIRIYPLLAQADVLLYLMIIIGILTAFYGWLSGLVQTDVKSGLIFSTTAQIGLMFVEIGLGWTLFAFIHLVLHSMWRAYQFLHAPGLMHLVPNKPRPVSRWLQKHPRLFTMALQRFWLDYIGDWLLVRPTKALSQDLHDFEQQIVIRLTGFPKPTSVVDALPSNKQSQESNLSLGGNLGIGKGIIGHLMYKTAFLLSKFEERFILQGAGSGLQQLFVQLGYYLTQIDLLLSRPRYLLVLIMATWAVII